MTASSGLARAPRRAALSIACALAVAALGLAGCDRSAPRTDSAPTPDSAPTTVSVTGLVVSARRQGPIAGARVVVPGHGEATTDAAGRFSIAAVKPPYAVVVVKNDGTRDHVSVYEGLSRADPVLAVGAFGPERSTTPPSGALADFGAVAGASVRVQCSGPEVNGLTMPVASDGTFPSSTLGPITWEGDAAISATCLALQRRETGGFPTDYVALWTTTAALESGVTPDPLTLVSTRVGARTVSLSLAAAPGATSLSLQAALRLGPTAAYELSMVSGAPAQVVEYLAPVVTGGTFQIALTAWMPGSAIVQAALDVPDDAAAATLSTPAALTLDAPAPDAQVAETTAFAWAPLPGAVHVLELTPQPSSGAPAVLVVGSGGRVDVARLRALGVSLPAGASYTWGVRAYAPVSVDGYATLGAVRDWDWFASWYAPYPSGGILWRSSARAFTVAPP